jgi:hypothetical protein
MNLSPRPKQTPQQAIGLEFTGEFAKATAEQYGRGHPPDPSLGRLGQLESSP